MNSALTFSKISSDQVPQLLREIRNILSEVGAHNVDIYDQTYWDWQYRDLPTGSSHTYAAWDGDRIIGYYHVPVYRFMVDGEEKRIGNIQDVAVDPNYRGMGLFRRLAEFANDDIDRSDVDLIYTFPNDKSIRTFLKYNGFSTVSAVPTCLRPVRSGGILRSKINLLGIERIIGSTIDSAVNLFTKRLKRPGAEVEIIRTMTDEVEAVFTEYATNFRNHLIRDKAWLNWRYVRSVRGKHHVLGLREKGELTAVVVLKEDEMLGNPALLIMDMAYLNGHGPSLLFLLDQVSKRNVLSDVPCHLLFISAMAPILPELQRIGFFRIPEKFNPRVLNLLSRSSSDLSEPPLLQAENWSLTLGDWDVF